MRTGLLTLSMAIGCVAQPGGDDVRADSGLARVSFEAEVLPIFRAHCVNCHGGQNPQAELDLTDPDAEMLFVPVNVWCDLGEGRVHSISAGAFHTCALFVDGRVRCWGRGTDGQLGGGCATLIGDEPGDMPPRDAWIFADNPPPIWPALDVVESCREVECIDGDCPGGVCSDGAAPTLFCPELGVPYRACDSDGGCEQDRVCARGCPIQREEVFYVPTAEQYWSGCVPVE